MTNTKTETSTLLNPDAQSQTPGHKDPNEKHVEEFFETQDRMAQRADAVNKPEAIEDDDNKGGEKVARDIAKAADEVQSNSG